MRVFVFTSNNYLAALRVYAHLFQKYWSPDQSVVVVGFDPPDFELPDNFSFHSMGKQDDYPVNRWSDVLIKFLHSIDDEVFVLMLEDYWLTRQVNTDAIHILYDYMMQFHYVVKMDLCGDRLYAHGMQDYDAVSYLDLIISMPGSPYHMSLMAGLWNREHLLRVLIPGETPWDIEINGTTRLSFMRDVIVLGTRQWPVRHILGLRGGEHSKVLTGGLIQSDIDELREAGLLAPWGVE